MMSMLDADAFVAAVASGGARGRRFFGISSVAQRQFASPAGHMPAANADERRHRKIPTKQVTLPPYALLLLHARGLLERNVRTLLEDDGDQLVSGSYWAEVHWDASGCSNGFLNVKLK